MKSSSVFLAMAAGALAQSSRYAMWPANSTVLVTYETITTTAFTTYCPTATVLTHGGNTYTVTEATMLTITDCPCTVTQPVTRTLTTTTILYTSCPPTQTASPPSPPPAQNPVSSPAQPPYTNPLTVVYTSTVTNQGQATPTPSATTTMPKGAAAGTGTGTGVMPSMFTDAANRERVGVMVVGALAGAVAFAL